MKTIKFTVIYCFLLVFLAEYIVPVDLFLSNCLPALILFCRKLAHYGQGGLVGQFGSF